METLTDNRTANILIAEFMGFQLTELGWFDDQDLMRLPEGNTFEELKFNTDWNWLMAVVGKISAEHAGGITYDVRNTLLVADIEKAYTAVVEFITWYNIKKKQLA